MAEYGANNKHSTKFDTAEAAIEHFT